MLVALAIAIPTLLLLYRQAGLSLGATRSASAYDQAVSRARSRLDALVDTALVPGDRDGEDGGGFRWRTRIVPVDTAAPGPARSARGAYAAGITLYDVSVALSWPGSGGSHSVVLQSRRLGPARGDLP